MTIAVGIIEDHDLFRMVLRTAIETMPGFGVGFEASDANGALLLLDGQDVGLVLVDLSLPDSNGIQLVTEIKRRRPHLPCVIVSGHTSGAYVRRALDAGALGYVVKGDPSELRAAIDAALAGDSYVSTALARA